MSGSETGSRHENWADGARGIAIVLVVIGHQISGLADAGVTTRSTTWNFFYNWIYCFHVPVFFFVAGFFITRSLRKALINFILDKARVLLYPYFVWSFFTLSIKTVFGSNVNNRYSLYDFSRIFYDPIDQYWFLFVLFFLYAFFAVQIKLGLNRWVIFVVAIIMDPRLSPLPFPPSPPIIEAGLSGVFMALGIVVGTTVMIKNPKTRILWFLVPVGYGVAALATLNWDPRFAFLSVVFTAGGISATIALSLLTEGVRFGRWLQYLGRNSLEIYLAHTFAAAGVRIALLKIGHISAIVPHFIFGTIAGVTLPLILVWVFKKIEFELAFRLPNALSAPLASPSATRN